MYCCSVASLVFTASHTLPAAAKGAGAGSGDQNAQPNAGAPSDPRLLPGYSSDDSGSGGSSSSSSSSSSSDDDEDSGEDGAGAPAQKAGRAGKDIKVLLEAAGPARGRSTWRPLMEQPNGL
jgi:hypothetical protein